MDLVRIARGTQLIAVIGLSANQDRPSWGVVKFLQSHGCRVIPVNTSYAGREILGQEVYPDLATIPSDIAVDIFRRSEAVPKIVDEVLAHLPALRLAQTVTPTMRRVAAETTAARDA